MAGGFFRYAFFRETPINTAYINQTIIVMNFEQFAAEANKFVREVADELQNGGDATHAYRVTKSVFHTVRDVLSPQESLHLVAQLPLLIKGVYVDGWHMDTKERIRSMPQFLDCLRRQSERSAGRDFGDDETAKRSVKAVLNVLKRRVAVGQIQDMIDQFPMELAGLWVTEETDAPVQR